MLTQYITAPPSGNTVYLPVTAGQFIELACSTDDVVFDQNHDDLTINFANKGSVVLAYFFSSLDLNSDRPVIGFADGATMYVKDFSHLLPAVAGNDTIISKLDEYYSILYMDQEKFGPMGGQCASEPQQPPVLFAEHTGTPAAVNAVVGSSVTWPQQTDTQPAAPLYGGEPMTAAGLDSLRNVEILAQAGYRENIFSIGTAPQLRVHEPVNHETIRFSNHNTERLWHESNGRAMFVSEATGGEVRLDARWMNQGTAVHEDIEYNVYTSCTSAGTIEMLFIQHGLLL